MIVVPTYTTDLRMELRYVPTVTDFVFFSLDLMSNGWLEAKSALEDLEYVDTADNILLWCEEEKIAITPLLYGSIDSFADNSLSPSWQQKTPTEQVEWVDSFINAVIPKYKTDRDLTNRYGVAQVMLPTLLLSKDFRKYRHLLTNFIRGDDLFTVCDKIDLNKLMD